MNNKTIKNETIINSMQGALVADAYALGSHWIYDETQLRNLPIDWEDLNTPKAMWHKGKEKGDFTHYGDHGKWLNEYIQTSDYFDPSQYAAFWIKKMENYQGYVDSSSRETLAILKNNPSTLCGASSHDLSIIGRIAPLLFVSKTKEEFLANTQMFVSLTHNSLIALKAAQFFASVLFDVALGAATTEAIKHTAVDPLLARALGAAINSQGQESFNAIRTFGPACGVEGGFEGTIHVLLSYDDYKSAMIANAQAGGDNAARGMIIGMIMGAALKEIPPAWKNGVKNL
ncbi:MAG: ADP-ribosylglycohydrolase family protein [Epsilonproteobacteria bacterium]|nr:ADP-ribosylglycohydrolase family protein [Campylobacterota bacterium]